MKQLSKGSSFREKYLSIVVRGYKHYILMSYVYLTLFIFSLEIDL